MLNKWKYFIKQYSQWFTPIILFVIAVSVFLAIFLNHTIQDSHDRAQADVVADALVMARTVDMKLVRSQTVVTMMQRGMSRLPGTVFVEASEGTADQEQLLHVLAGAVHAANGYAAVVVNENGDAFAAGIDGMFSVADKSWYPEIVSMTPGDTRVFHVTDDELDLEEEADDAVVCAGAFEMEDGTVGKCLYFDNSWIDALAKTGKGKSLMTIVKDDGQILMRSEVSDYFVRGNDYWALIGGNANITAKYHITQKDSYAVYDATNNYTVIEIPLTGVAWAACVSVSGSFIDALSTNYFTATRNFVMELLISVVLFFALIIILNTVAKIRRLRESQALGEKADHDQLTGLRNKAATERDIKEYIEQNPSTQSVLFILDIDDFKTVNDTMGHSFGDDVLHEFGFRLGSMFRASDISGRIGGDEFMVFVKNIPDEATIEKEARKIREFIHSFRAGVDVKREITASSGAAVFPQDGKDFETLYKSADKALYESKRSGKRQLAFFRH